MVFWYPQKHEPEIFWYLASVSIQFIFGWYGFVLYIQNIHKDTREDSNPAINLVNFNTALVYTLSN